MEAQQSKHKVNENENVLLLYTGEYKRSRGETVTWIWDVVHKHNTNPAVY